MRRIVLGIVMGAAVAIPATFGAAALGLTADEPVSGVPAAECPEAVATMAEQGLEPADYFIPDCPDPSQMTLDTVMSPDAVLAADRGCESYTEKPSWCPTPTEVEKARLEAGGPR